MVEGALGVKANVSQEKKQAERHELTEARGKNLYDVQSKSFFSSQKIRC